MLKRFAVVFAVAMALVLGFSGNGYSAAPTTPAPRIVPVTVDTTIWTSSRLCMMRFFVDEIYAGHKGGVAWILQNVSNQNFEGDVVVGNATQHIISGPWEAFSVNNDVNVSESGSFTMTFWLKEGLNVDMTEFCRTLWNGAWNLSIRP